MVPTGLPELIVRPGGRVVLPVVASNDQQRGLRAGTPCPAEGVARQRRRSGYSMHTSTSSNGHIHSAQPGAGLAGTAGTAGTPRGFSEGASSSTLGTTSSGDSYSAAAQARPLLFFRFAEQADICGPVHLDR